MKFATIGLCVSVFGAGLSVLALAISCAETFFGESFGLSEVTIWGVPGVNGVMQLLLLVGAALLLLGVVPAGRQGLRYIVLESQLVASGIIFFAVPSDWIHLARIAVLLLTFYALWRFGLLRGSTAKISSLGTELLGWGKALNSFSGLAAGGDLLFIASYIQYRRHRQKIDLLWTMLNLPFALLAHAELAATLAEDIGWHEALHLHCAGVLVLWGSWFLVLQFRTSVDLDGPHKPKPPAELLPRPDLHWRWDEKTQEWLAFGACGTRFRTGCPQSGFSSATDWELNPQILAWRKRRHELRQLARLTPSQAAELEELEAKVSPILNRINSRWSELGAVTREEIQTLSASHYSLYLDTLMSRRTEHGRGDIFERFCSNLLPER